MNNASCGDTIRLAAGTYSGAMAINRSCPANNPVIVQGAANFASTATGTWTITGARNIVTGVRFTTNGTQVRFSGTNNRLLANEFTNFRRCIVVLKPGQYGEIAYNEFHDPAPYAGTGYQDRICIRTGDDTTADVQTDVWVHHNMFRDFPQKPDPNNYSSGQNDAIEICETNNQNYSPSFSGGWYIEHNMLLRHRQGHGTIDLKCPGRTVVRYNTFLNTPGRIDIRGRTSIGATIESNWLDGSWGMVIHGRNNRIIGNRLIGGSIDLRAGSYECDGTPPSSGAHARVCDTLVAGNNSAIEIGVSSDNLPAIGTTIEQHTGSITLSNHSKTTNTSSQQTTVKFAPAFKLNSTEVGPAAISQASASYLGCRLP